MRRGNKRLQERNVCKCVRKSKKGHLIVLYWKKNWNQQFILKGTKLFKNDPSINTIHCTQLYIFQVLHGIHKDQKLIMKEREHIIYGIKI